jgi:DNA-binding NtrC family response regulator
MATRRFEDTSPAVTVLVVDKDEAIRSALGDLLEDAGYAVAEAESLHEAESLIDASPEPLVLIVGDAETYEHTGLRFFTAVAANPVTRHAYVYLTSTPERANLPALVERFATLENLSGDLPVELETLLAVVADAAARLRRSTSSRAG